MKIKSHGQKLNCQLISVLKTYIPKFVVYMVLFLICTSINAQEANEYSDTEDVTLYWENLLEDAIEQGNYEDGKNCFYELQRNGYVSEYAIYSAATCFKRLSLYEECMEAVREWTAKNECSFPWPNLIYGECYYYTDDYSSAKYYLDQYITWANDNDFELGSYEYGIYAQCLKKLYRYAEAEIYYTKFLSTFLQEEDVSLEKCYLSSEKKYVGWYLYNMAYNAFFQGKEKEGMQYLYLSYLCGEEYAEADYPILSGSSILGKDLHYKKSTVREFEKYITLYSPKLRYRGDDWWENVYYDNPRTQELVTNLKKDRRPGTLKQAVAEYKSAQLDYNAFLQPYEPGNFEKKLSFSLKGEGMYKDLMFYPASSANAFATPTDNIYVTSALAELYHYDISLLTGVCAHELGHITCAHILNRLWAEKKKEKRNNIWAGVAVGLNTMAHAATSMYAASNGVSYDQSYWDGVISINNNLMQSFKEGTYYFRFKYSREDEIEADILAYKYCEYVGIGGYAYIMALSLLGDDNQGYYKASKTSTHPTNYFRINLLRYLYQKEHNQ